MEEQSTNTIAAFDSLFTTNRIQMLKILLPRLIPGQQGGFAIYIKLLELQYTFSFLRLHPGIQLFGDSRRLNADFFQDDSEDTFALLDELLPFSGPQDRTRIQNMKNMMSNFKKMKEMMSMIQMMQEFFPEGMGGDQNPMDLFYGLSGMPNMPDMAAMADMASLFGAMSSGQESPRQEKNEQGNNEHENAEQAKSDEDSCSSGACGPSEAASQS